MNQVFLIGNLGSDPETKKFESGTSVTELSLAVNRRYKSASGDKAEETTWFRCKAWGKGGDIIQQYAKKGHKIAVTGRIDIRKDDQGRYWTEIVVSDFEFLGGKTQGDDGIVKTKTDDDGLPAGW
tara:strand:+ start:3046 stop:3420 length:375 start_codon:yes stop_codon:yes gene_type:complete